MLKSADYQLAVRVIQIAQAIDLNADEVHKKVYEVIAEYMEPLVADKALLTKEISIYTERLARITNTLQAIIDGELE